MIKSAIMQPTFLPWCGYFDLMDEVDVFVFLDDVQFDYRSWQHKNNIKDLSNKNLTLTVPVLNGQKKQKLNEVLIFKESNFIKKHLKSIFFNYKKTKYFEAIFSEIKKIFEKNHTHLINLNYDLINYVCNYLNIKKKFIKSSSLETSKKKDELILEILKKIGSKKYFSPAGSLNYLKLNMNFEKEGIDLFFQDFTCKEYKQLSGNFISHLSVLDLIMNEGPDSKKIILKGKKYKKHDF